MLSKEIKPVSEYWFRVIVTPHIYSHDICNIIAKFEEEFEMFDKSSLHRKLKIDDGGKVL